MQFTKKKALATVAVASVVALGAGSAYAFWTTTGSGSGSASVGTDAGFSITGDITPALLLDQARPFTITVANGATFAQHLTNLSFDFTPSNAGCLKTWFTAVQPTIPAGGVEVAAGSSSTFGASLTLNNLTTTNQDACKNNTITVSYTSS